LHLSSLLDYISEDQGADILPLLGHHWINDTV
jgi:hypothetical protein